MCTCVEDLYWAEIRVPLGPTVLLGVGALLVYRLVKYVVDAAGAEDADAEYTDTEDTDAEYTDTDEDPDAGEDPGAEDTDAGEDPDDAPFDPTDEDPDTEYPYYAGLTVSSFDQGASPEIFLEDDTVYETSLIDAPTRGPSLVISSTEEASSDAALPLPETSGRLSGSSPPDAV